jgi:hypothetical protein
MAGSHARFAAIGALRVTATAILVVDGGWPRLIMRRNSVVSTLRNFDVHGGGRAYALLDTSYGGYMMGMIDTMGAAHLYVVAAPAMVVVGVVQICDLFQLSGVEMAVIELLDYSSHSEIWAFLLTTSGKHWSVCAFVIGQYVLMPMYWG